MQPVLQRSLAVIQQRCPVCLRGQVFSSWFEMNRDCPACGIHFERETGYFLNAMFAAYALGFLLLVPSAIWLYFQGVSLALFSGVILLEIVVLWPLIFRYSRILWLHLDQLLDPRKPAL